MCTKYDVFVLNMTGFVLKLNVIVLNMTGFDINMTGFVLNLTGREKGRRGGWEEEGNLLTSLH